MGQGTFFYFPIRIQIFVAFKLFTFICSELPMLYDVKFLKYCTLASYFNLLIQFYSRDTERDNGGLPILIKTLP